MNKTLRNLALVALATAPFSAFAEIVGAGTAENPYQIATAEDLCNANEKVVAGQVIYFVQTADIDMTGKTSYKPINGGNGDYTSAIVYDGRNHVISNFAPKAETPDAGLKNYYNVSVFGVLTGHLKNLGVVDANIVVADVASYLGAGVLGGYAGHGSAPTEYATTTIENVYVTGTINGGKAGYTGGLFGTNGSEVIVKNCFANVTVTGDNTNVAGICGRLRNPMSMENVYVAGSVDKGALVVSSDKTPALTATDVIAFNSGVENAVVGATLTGKIQVANAANKDELLAAVKAWPAFSATETVDGFPALKYALSGAGTEADPYQITCKEDLCNAYKYVNGVTGGDFYFIQTADIDMDGVEEYHALAGYDGAYNAKIYYNGQNHIISNFAPADFKASVDPDAYYCTSIFGVPAGEISNLGVVDAYCSTTQGAGILGAYAGHGNVNMGLTLNNVFVHGEVSGEGGYTGGMFGTNAGGALSMINCFANVKVSGKAYTAGIIGRLDKNLVAENVYVAGSVAGDDPFLVAGSRGKAAHFDGLNVIAFNEGATAALASDIVEDSDPVTVATAETKDELIAEVHTWVGFSETKDFEGYPALADFENVTSGITDVVVKDAAEIEANGAAVYYNLQGVQVANPDNGIYIVRRGNKVTKELIRK